MKLCITVRLTKQIHQLRFIAPKGKELPPADYTDSQLDDDECLVMESACGDTGEEKFSASVTQDWNRPPRIMKKRSAIDRAPLLSINTGR